LQWREREKNRSYVIMCVFIFIFLFRHRAQFSNRVLSVAKPKGLERRPTPPIDMYNIK
jgi:hypothetical protein